MLSSLNKEELAHPVTVACAGGYVGVTLEALRC
jgi:hypothetical protein